MAKYDKLPEETKRALELKQQAEKAAGAAAVENQTNPHTIPRQVNSRQTLLTSTFADVRQLVTKTGV